MPQLSREEQSRRDKEYTRTKTLEARAKKLFSQLKPEMFVNHKALKRLASRGRKITLLQCNFRIGDRSEYFKQVRELNLEFDRLFYFFATKARVHGDKDGLYSVLASVRYINITITDYLKSKGLHMELIKKSNEFERWEISLIKSKEKECQVKK